MSKKPGKKPTKKELRMHLKRLTVLFNDLSSRQTEIRDDFDSLAFSVRAISDYIFGEEDKAHNSNCLCSQCEDKKLAGGDCD